MVNLTPDRFSVQALNALQQASSIAGRARAPLIAPSHLMASVLQQKDGDAYGVLAALGHDPVSLAKQLAGLLGSRQIIVAGDAAQSRLDASLQGALATSFAEAEAAGSPFATTRDLLVGVLASPDSVLAELLPVWQIDRNAISQAPVSVYERAATAAAAQKQAAHQAKKRTGWRISPLFLGLLAALIACGAWLYTQEEAHPIVVFVFVTLGWIVSLALHEFGHAMAAYWGGDYSVEERGYLTLNPLKYTHPLLSIIMPVIFLLLGGIGLPGGAVYVNLGAIRTRWMQSTVAAAGPAANALFATLLAMPFLLNGDGVFYMERPTFWASIALLIFLQITAIVLNLMPIPGLDGFGILAPWLPLSVHRMLAPVYSFGFILLIFLFWYVDAFSEFFWAAVWFLILQLKLFPGLVEFGFSMYRFWMP